MNPPSAKFQSESRRIPAPAAAVVGIAARIFGDTAIQHGIKCGLSAMLAWWVVQVLRLQNPGWSLITVFVLALSPYVGSMGEKGLLRVIGTAIGGMLGMLLIGNFADSAVITLGGTFLVLTVCTWLFGSNRFPYAFFLCALTLLVVVSASLHDPSNSWEVALHRFLEVSVGVGSSLLVNSLLWPRYARTEFKNHLDVSLTEMHTMFADTVHAAPTPPGQIESIERTFLANLSNLRILLRFGAAESLEFRRRTGIYMQLIPEISLLFLSVAALRRTGGSQKPASDPETSGIAKDIAKVEQGLLEFWSEIRSRHDTAAAVTETEILAKIEETKAAVARWLESVGCGKPGWIPSDAVTDCAALTVSLEDIYYHLRRIEELFVELTSPRADSARTVNLYAWSPRLRRYWLRSAIKGAIAACAALLLCDWLNPPGSYLVPLAAWMMVVLPRGYVRGEGDRRTFQYAAVAGLVLLGFSLFVLAFVPLMASYAVTNVTLFTMLFIYGFIAIRKGGITYFMQIGLLAGVSLMALNPQEPVTFQAVTGVFLGILLGVLIGAVVQRLFWPMLPARELRDTVLEFLQACRDFPSESQPDRALLLRATLSLTPSEMTGWAHRLDTPEIPSGEVGRWDNFVRALQDVGGAIRAVQRLFQDPAMRELSKKITPQLDAAREQLNGEFDALLAAFRQGDTAALAQPLPSKSDADSILEAFESVRLNGPECAQILALVHRWRTLENALQACRNAATALQLPRYLGDYAL